MRKSPPAFKRNIHHIGGPIPTEADAPSSDEFEQAAPEKKAMHDLSGVPTDESITVPSDTTASPETYNENPAHEAHPDDEEDHPPLDGIDTRPKPTPKPSKLSIIERFARDQGFLKDSETRFFHENGSWIAKTNGERFPWEHRTTTGDLIRYYLPKDHCLEQDPLQVEADIWGLIEQHPDTYALILSSLANTPIEMRGNQLLCMKEQGKIILYPASYRLVYKGV